MRALDEQIAQHLKESAASGEPQSAPSYGKPLALNDGYEQTPEELRMAFKVLKDAGVVPHEVAMMRELAGLKQQLDGANDEAHAAALRLRVSELQQNIALRLEKLRVTRSL